MFTLRADDAFDIHFVEGDAPTPCARCGRAVPDFHFHFTFAGRAFCAHFHAKLAAEDAARLEARP